MNELSFLNAVLLGVVQGATEFLPISSSAHLVFAQHFLNVPLEAAPLLAFDIYLHFGTLLAVMVYFWRELKEIACWTPEGRKLGLILLVGTIPAAVIGILFKETFEILFSDVTSTAWQLIITGFLLWATRWMKEGSRGMNTIGVWRSLAVGLGQAIAIIPGISRSGSTIAAALLFKLNRDAAARFSFLLSIPAIAGATLMSIGDLGHFSRSDLGAATLGTVISFLVAIISIKWLLGIIRRGQLSWFALYCWVIGALVLVVVA